MFKDYKFWFIKRDDYGFITEAAIRFYEGEYRNVEVDDLLGGKIILNKYIRTKRLDVDVNELDGKTIKDSAGNKARLFTLDNFGQIKTDDELQEFLNKELNKIKGREAIPEQKWLP